MHKRNILRLVFLLCIGCASLASGSPRIVVPKWTADTNGFFSETMQQESHLPVALFHCTNAPFEHRLYESVSGNAKPPVIISFHLVSFVFSSPNTNDLVFSSCEMGSPDELVCNGKSVSRRPGSTNEIPLIRVSTVDRRKNQLTADLDLLLGVAPLSDPQDKQYFRRSFRFVYADGWKEDR
ncbi:MAG TPA: hypothetical protein VEC99_14625 [Clostridia bacterium]|nr:hypothetical protein [Clostridia bacterium]